MPPRKQGAGELPVRRGSRMTDGEEVMPPRKQGAGELWVRIGSGMTDGEQVMPARQQGAGEPWVRIGGGMTDGEQVMPVRQQGVREVRIRIRVRMTDRERVMPPWVRVSLLALAVTLSLVFFADGFALSVFSGLWEILWRIAPPVILIVIGCGIWLFSGYATYSEDNAMKGWIGLGVSAVAYMSIAELMGLN